MVETAGLNLRDQVGTLMDMSRSLRGRVDVSNVLFPIRKIISEQVRMHEAGLSAEVKIRADLPVDFPSHILGDPDRYSLIVQNLLRNAVAHTETGEISMSLSWTDARTLRTVISDTGSGIAYEDRERLFEPFYQVRSIQTPGKSGMGLGLALVKHNVDVMNGTVDVESEQGRGTSFIVDLPLEACPVWFAEGAKGMFCSRCVSRPAGSRTPLSEMRMAEILSLQLAIVEDNEVNRFLLEKRLEQAGFQNIILAADGRTAVEKIAGSRAAIVLLDMHLPDMDGIAVADELRRRGFQGESIAVTSDTSDEMRARIRSAHIYGIAPKPVAVDSIIQMILDITAARARK